MNFNEIFIVLVLYKSNLRTSNTIQSICNNYDGRLKIFIFDNSPKRQYIENEFMYKNLEINYYHSRSNVGLSYAYNYALQEANNLKLKWILLLDQDTYITRDYFDELLNIDNSIVTNNIVSIIPRVISVLNNKNISPRKLCVGGLNIPIAIKSGIVTRPISGINSGTILCISFLNTINGFSNEYTLDMLDHWYFKKIYSLGKCVFLLNSSIKQNLSILGKFEENITIDRYRQLLYAENNFIKEFNNFHLIIFKFRLIVRCFKQVRFKNRKYLKLTLSYVFKNN